MSCLATRTPRLVVVFAIDDLDCLLVTQFGSLAGPRRTTTSLGGFFHPCRWTPSVFLPTSGQAFQEDDGTVN